MVISEVPPKNLVGRKVVYKRESFWLDQWERGSDHYYEEESSSGQTRLEGKMRRSARIREVRNVSCSHADASTDPDVQSSFTRAGPETSDLGVNNPWTVQKVRKLGRFQHCILHCTNVKREDSGKSKLQTAEQPVGQEVNPENLISWKQVTKLFSGKLPL